MSEGWEREGMKRERDRRGAHHNARARPLSTSSLPPLFLWDQPPGCPSGHTRAPLRLTHQHMPSLTDHFMHVLLADASWGADPSAPGRQPVRVNFFARDPAALPRPRRPAGDIIRLHRARVRMFTEREREREREREKERRSARVSLNSISHPFRARRTHFPFTGQHLGRQLRPQPGRPHRQRRHGRARAVRVRPV